MAATWGQCCREGCGKGSGPLALKYSLRLSYTLKKKGHWERGKTDQEREKSQKDTKSLSPPQAKFSLNSLPVPKEVKSKHFDINTYQPGNIRTHQRARELSR